jgi:hypothetical protein
MLKPLVTNCILHLLKYIETNAIQCFVIILECFSEFFHIYWTINIFTWVEPSTLNLLKPLFKCCILNLLVYILKHTQQFNASYLYLNMLVNFLHLLNYQPLHMNWIIHFECVKSIIHKLHFAFIIIFWNKCIKVRQVSHLYLNGLTIRSNVHAC